MLKSGMKISLRVSCIAFHHEKRAAVRLQSKRMYVEIPATIICLGSPISGIASLLCKSSNMALGVRLHILRREDFIIRKGMARAWHKVDSPSGATELIERVIKKGPRSGEKTTILSRWTKTYSKS